MATKSVDLPEGFSAVITNDPKQVHMERLLQLQLLARKDESVLSEMPTAALVAYTDSWNVKDEEGVIPLSEEHVRNRVRNSIVAPLYQAIDDFIAETAPKIPNARAPRPKR